MCLSIPMKITAIRDLEAKCEIEGMVRTASLLMMPENTIKTGDFVVIQSGYVVRVVSGQEASESWKLFKQILNHLDTDHPDKKKI